MKLSKSAVLGIVQTAGLASAILGHVEPTDIEDRHLAQLWSKAQQVLQDIEESLEVVTGSGESQ